MKKTSLFSSLGFVLLLLLPACSETKAPCVATYSGQPQDVQVVWTAFKFTGKTPVKGRFAQMDVAGVTAASSLKELIQGLSIEIDGASVETDNPGRNATLQQFFFEKIPGGPKLKASVSKVEGDEQKGTLTLKLTVNGVAKEVPFSYTATPEGAFEAKGSIDMMDFGLQPAFDSLHSACADLHKGPDGVSKTWTQVDLSVTGKFKKSC